MQAETTYNAILGRLINRKRLEKQANDPSENWSSAGMAKKMGISTSAWSRIERGDVSLSAEQLQRIAIIFNITPGEIMEEAESAKQALEKQGVNVRTAQEMKKEKQGKWGVALLAAGALAGLIGAALADNDSENDPQNKGRRR